MHRLNRSGHRPRWRATGQRAATIGDASSVFLSKRTLANADDARALAQEELPLLRTRAHGILMDDTGYGDIGSHGRLTQFSESSESSVVHPWFGAARNLPFSALP